jgi:hypothetical protein
MRPARCSAAVVCGGLLLAGCSTASAPPWSSADDTARRILGDTIAYERAAGESSAHGPIFPPVSSPVPPAQTVPSWTHDAATAGMTAATTVGGLKLAERLSSSGAAQAGRPAALAAPAAAAVEEKIAGRLLTREAAAVTAAELAVDAEAFEGLELLLLLLF